MTRFDFEAGHLTLDFANTADWHASDQPEERLTDYRAVVAWGSEAGLLDDEMKARYEAMAEEESAAAAAHERALLLREVVYRVFAAVADGREPAQEDLDLLRLFLQISLHDASLAVGEGGFDWVWSVGEEELAAVLGPVAQQGVELLRSGELERVGQCADDRGCGWLFYDHSRNKSRRWCSMESCGNRAKAMRYYERTQEEEG
ncbi:MAG: CGNR zinc finger domain-containing protein [Anaerolineales bacterium]|nr:CGNR zinc finger domain-containing protein [Anaerolineales bacterium]